MTNFMADMEFLQALAAHVDQLLSEAQQDAPSISSIFTLLELGWQGQSRQRFDARYADFRQYNDRLVNAAQQLRQHLYQEIVLLEEIQRSTSISFAP
jgi:uncharacterized protein YukE